jgi:hypothetical protein
MAVLRPAGAAVPLSASTGRNSHGLRGPELPGGLVSALERHVERAPTLIQGWEADKRTCVGAKRGPLRQAARGCYSASKKARAGSASAAADQAYRAAVQKLLQELELAGEADFDGLIKEALTWFTGDSQPAPLAELAEEHQAAFARVKKHLYHGKFFGKASERDMTAATAAAVKVREALRELERSPGAPAATEAYIAAADALAAACAKVGEVDYDGLLRQAIQVLESSGESGKAEGDDAPKAASQKRPLEKGKGMKGKGKGYGKSSREAGEWGSHNAAAA